MKPVYAEQDTGSRYACTRWQEKLLQEDANRMALLNELVAAEMAAKEKRSSESPGYACVCQQCGQTYIYADKRRRYCRPCERSRRQQSCRTTPRR